MARLDILSQFEKDVRKRDIFEYRLNNGVRYLLGFVTGIFVGFVIASYLI
jgi:hypothetical protein